MKRLLAGLGSLIVLAVLLVGIPAVLIFVAGNPIPSWDVLQAAVTRPDYGGAFLLGNLLPIVAWIAWATFAVSVITVIPSTIRGIRPPRIPGLGFQQRTATALLGTVIIMFTGFTGAATAATPATAAPMETSSYSATQDAAASTGVTDSNAVAESASSSAGELPQYQVKSGDTLWTIAQAELGDGKRYTEIAQLNYDVTQEDGGKLTPNNHWAAPGWILELPTDGGTHDAVPSATITPAPAAASTTTADAATVPAETSVPAAETPASTKTTQDEQRMIQPGDTLWDIAEEEYGAGDRYPEIFEASNDAVQANGQQLSDPNLILPGWEITVPNVAMTVPAAPAPVTPAPTAPTNGGNAGAGADTSAGANAGIDAGSDTAGAGAGAGAGDGADVGSGASESTTEEDVNSSNKTQPAEPQPGSAEDDENALADIFASPTMTIGGIGSLLAAGILSLLGIRRFQQRRNRKPGQRISMPDLQTATTELELRAVEDPQAVNDIDHALRFLASWARDTESQLPKLFALRLSEETVELYLDEPADLPAPFLLVSDDRMAWSVKPAEIPEFAPRPTAPYPGLVTLGQDPANGHILVDLEQIGSLNIQGPDDETTEGALTALAIELACSKWADDLQVTVVGFAPELAAAFNTGRIQYVDDVRSLMSSLRGRARAYTQAFEDLHVDGPQHARTTADTDTWTPEIVLLRHLPDEKTQAELIELIEHTPHVGIAAITHGQLTGTWSLNITQDRSAVLNPAGISITAQIVAGAEYQHILDSLTIASRHAVTPTADVEFPAPSAELLTTAEGDTEVTIEQAPVSTSSTATRWDFALDEDDDETPETAIPTAVDQTTEGEPTLVDQVDESTPAGEIPAEEIAPALEDPAAKEEPLELPAPTAPVIRVLGPIRIEGAKGPEPRNAKTTYVNPATELLVFLALNPGASAEQVSQALWPGKPPVPKPRNELMSRTRRWLGKNAAGEDYLPYVTTGTYGLHPDVTIDWGTWNNLVGHDLENTPTRNLVAAMKLVDGQPFDGAPRRRYVWNDDVHHEMIASIVDAAHELAERALSIRDVSTARLASIVGEKVDPASEIPVRDRLRAEALANDDAGVERVIARLDLHLEELAEGGPDEEPEEETQQLIDELRNRRIAS